MSSRLQARTSRPVPPPSVVQDAAIVSSFLSDAAHVPGGFASGVAFPHTEGEVAALVRGSRTILPVGAQSSLTGGATPRGDLVLSTRALDAIELLDRQHVRVGAGVTLANLQQQLASHGLYYPPAPTYDGAFVGGTISTNAAGAATFKYGSTRPWVQQITVVLADGSLLDLTRGTVAASPSGTLEFVSTDDVLMQVMVPRYVMPTVPKLSAGYYAALGMDAIDLFIGSEGTLGVITSAMLRVIERPTRRLALVTCADDHQALGLTAALREAARLAWTGRGALDVSAIEYMDARSLRLVPDMAFAKAGVARPSAEAALLLVQMEVAQHDEATLAAFADLLDATGITVDPLVTAPGDDRAVQRLFELREAVPASVNAMVAAAKRQDERIQKTAGDLIVPFDALEPALAMYRRVLEARQLDYAIWGHASDGNLHVNVVPHSVDEMVAGREAVMEMAREVITMGGSPLAEHGVGRSAMKQRLLQELYGVDGIDEMRRVKRAFDPEWKLAPGVLFDEARARPESNRF